MRSYRTMWIGAVLLVALVAAPGAQERQIVVQGGNVDIRLNGGDMPPEIAALLGRGLAPMSMGTGIIVGQAVEATTGQPIPGSLVTLSLPGSSPLRVLADGQGRFAFRSLPPGSFSLSAAKPGFVDGAFGRRRPSGPTQPIVLADGDHVTDASIPLWRYSAVAGVVTDERGEPVVGATVQALVRTTVAGMPKLSPGAMDETDDRGVYRIGMLEPGDYVVVMPAEGRGGQFVVFDGPGGGAVRATFASAAATQVFREGPNGLIADEPEELVGPAGVAPDGTPLTYQTLFYPAATLPSRAATVRLGSGEERDGLDFERRPVRSSRVSGMVTGPDGPAPNQTLTLVPAGSDDLTSPVGTYSTRSGPDGRYAFKHVAPGEYTLRVAQAPRVRLGGGTEQIATGGGGTFVMRSVVSIGRGGAMPPLPDELTLWAEVPVSVAGDVEAPVVLNTGVRVSGQVSFTGGTERPAGDVLPSIRVSLDAADGPTSALDLSLRGRIETSGLFKTMSLPPGKYFIRADGLPQGWYFKGAMLGGRDVSDTPLTVQGEDINGVTLVFTDQQTELSGSVTNTDNQGDSGALVIAFPTDRSGWVNYGTRPRRLRSARVGADGSYRISGLPAGEYFVAAVPDESAGDWQRPEFLDAVAASAGKVRIGDGGKQTLSLQVVR